MEDKVADELEIRKYKHKRNAEQLNGQISELKEIRFEICIKAYEELYYKSRHTSESDRSISQR